MVPVKTPEQMTQLLDSGQVDAGVLSPSAERRNRYLFSRAFVLDPLSYVVGEQHRNTAPEALLKSGTVAMVTSASIVAPMAATLGLNPTLGALACCTGAFIFSYFNDSYYWVVTRMLGVSDVREQIRIWSVTTTICWAVGCTILIVAGFFV